MAIILAVYAEVKPMSDRHPLSECITTSKLVLIMLAATIITSLQIVELTHSIGQQTLIIKSRGFNPGRSSSVELDH